MTKMSEFAMHLDVAPVLQNVDMRVQHDANASAVAWIGDPSNQIELCKAMTFFEHLLTHGRRQVKFYESLAPMSRASFFKMKRRCLEAGLIHQSVCSRYIEPDRQRILDIVQMTFPTLCQKVCDRVD
ncbi:hypothetical protein [Frigidibacter oleivorans]|uniref:hypothetical protein n=1 Tax=Frigidibacter oleivorans TaxID=2487129 RepID=UPI000F8E02CD|nr:hypothetical protein [Frigidibacter oleivorans]